MRRARTPDPRVCSIDAAMRVLGEKWALLALREIAFGVRRFDDIVFNTGAARNILASRLKSLEAAGVITRQQYETSPARYEYSLSEAGDQLIMILHTIRDWGDRYARTDPENIVAFRHSCGAVLHPETHCGACGEVLGPSSVITADRDVHQSDLAAAGGAQA
ncbi:winged helix-turn-helix transcriptional regulator [Streptomyces sp. NPDC102270]|uniref:winged helix-turn-helix transcriptional regulator n=1 Tax=Streptomyces sp. NPDC102270 TaxID=3366150 RepID=UPI0037F75325